MKTIVQKIANGVISLSIATIVGVGLECPVWAVGVVFVILTPLFNIEDKLNIVIEHIKLHDEVE